MDDRRIMKQVRLLWRDGWLARDTAIEFIEGAFQRSSNHQATVSSGSETPDPKEEAIHDGFSGPEPCGTDEQWYGDLRAWWLEWLNC